MKFNIKKLWNKLKPKMEWSASFIANICQIVIVLVAIVEYQKNIKPTFQNQLLSEENAKLTLENRELKEESTRIKESISFQITEKEKQIELLQAKYDDINSQYEIAYGKLKAIETEQEKKDRILKIQKEKEEIVNSIYAFNNMILKKCGPSRSNLIFNEITILLSEQSRNDEVLKEEKLYSYPLQNIDKMISKYFYNPYFRIYKSLDEIRSENLKNENKQITEYIDVIKSILKEKELYIVFEQNKVSNLEKELKEYKKQVDVLNGISIKEDINILSKQWEIERKARDSVSELEKSLIDYNDIMNPVIDEMISYYLNKYNTED